MLNMEVTFYLRNELLNKKGFAPLRMHITVNGELLKKSVSGVKVKPKHWREDKQRIKPNKVDEEYNFHEEYNDIIEELKMKVRSIERHALSNKVHLTKAYVETKLEEKITLAGEHDFFELFQAYIDDCRPVNAKSTIKGYNTVKNFLFDFCQETGNKLILSEINLDTFSEIRKYAFGKRNTYNNYFAKIISVLKRFLKWARKKKLHSNMEFLEFKAKEQETEVIYLTIPELLKLYNHVFKSDKLNRVRDAYCFACFTGLRFSDFSKLNKSYIYDDHIKLRIDKTKDPDHIIPLNKYSKSILDRYRGTIYEPIPIISEQKFNDYIKDCCKEVEINKQSTITRYIGSDKVEITSPKYEFITSHTARKTFATNSLILGMKERTVRSITGHKKEESFRRYVHLADEYKKKEMEESWDKL